MQFTQPAATVTATLTAGTQVALAAGSQVGLAAGSQVGLAAGSSVGLAAGSSVGISGTPTVVASGASTGSNPVDGAPAFANRAAPASSIASGVATLVAGGNASATVIAAPGATRQIELHKCILTITIPSTVGTNQPIRLARSDTQAAVASPGISGTVTQVQWTYDFEGALLPLNVGLVLFTNSSGTGSASVSYVVNYTTVGV